MILYHGTNTDFDKIDLTKCLPNKDFGHGFYLTPSKHDATLRASDKCAKEQSGEPTILRFNWVESNCSDLKIKRFKCVNEEWARFIIENRKRKGKKHNFDIVIGPVADDGVVLSLQLFEAGVLTMNALIERLRFARPTLQYCFCTQKAINQLQRV